MSEEEFPSSAFDDLGYEVVVYGQKAWNGVAILSRHPAEPTLRGLPGQEDFGARLVGARIAGLTFATVYCPNGKDLDARGLRAQARRGTTTSRGTGPPGSGRTRRRSFAGTSTSCPRRSTPGAARRARAPSSIPPRNGRGSARCSISGSGISSGRRLSGRPGVLLVGLPGGRVSPRARASHRLPPRHEPVLDRVAEVEIDRDFRKKQEGPHRIGPRAGHRRSRLGRSLIVLRRTEPAERRRPQREGLSAGRDDSAALGHDRGPGQWSIECSIRVRDARGVAASLP